jgi:hypothetical protein
MSALGHSRPSHFVPVLNSVRYASDSDHLRYESELTLSRSSLLPTIAAPPLGSLTSAGTPLIEAENLFRQPGPPQKFWQQEMLWLVSEG